VIWSVLVDGYVDSTKEQDLPIIDLLGSDVELLLLFTMWDARGARRPWSVCELSAYITPFIFYSYVDSTVI
jgi:hypothetical protein